MIPRTLYMRNFMCYREQTLDFRGIHLACLTGNNGHGKSAILDAITWAIWGRSRVGARRDDELIYLGQSEMEVEFEFDLVEGTTAQPSNDSVRYRVIRKRRAQKRGQSSLELQGWDTVDAKYRSLSEPHIAQTQLQINKLLRMDYDTFVNSALLLQGRADEFTIKRPAERKRVLGNILGLEIYDRYEKLAKESAKEHKTCADQLLAAIEQIGRELAHEPGYRSDVETAETELAELQIEHATTEETYTKIRASLQEAESAQKQLAAIKHRLATTREEIRRLDQERALHNKRLQALRAALAQEAEIEAGFNAYQVALVDSEALNAKLAESATLKERHSELRQLITAARHKIDTAHLTTTAQAQQAIADIAQIKESISKLSGDHDVAYCPLCGHSLDDSKHQDLLAGFQKDLATKNDVYHSLDRQRQDIESKLSNKEYVPEHQAALIQVEHQLEALGYDAQAHHQLQADLAKLRPFESQIHTLHEARSGLDTVRQIILHLEQSRSQVEERLQEDQLQAGELGKITQQIPTLKHQAQQARQVLETAHDREQQANMRLGAARNNVSHCADLKRQQVGQKKEEAQRRKEQAIYQDLQYAFGKNGVQAMLIESAVPDIEQEANRLLARMTQGRMHVRFETQRDTKKGSTIETLDIHITDELGTRSYETYSGGERYRINFAIRIALSKLLARRAGAQLQTLVIDEGFGTQDAEGRDGIIDAINAVCDDFACILVITHIEELKEAFNVRIEVSKAAQGSEITVI